MKQNIATVLVVSVLAFGVGCSGSPNVDDGSSDADEAAFTAGDVYRKRGTFELQEIDTRTIDMLGCFQGRAPCSNPPLPVEEAGAGTVEIRTKQTRSASDTTRVSVRIRRPDFDGTRVTERFTDVELVNSENGYSSSVWGAQLPVASGRGTIRLSFANDGFRHDFRPDTLRWVEVKYTSDTHTLEMLVQ